MSGLCWATSRFSSTVMPWKQPDVLEGARDARLAGDLVVGHALEQKEFAVRRRRDAGRSSG